jgi:hypothetical protein
VLELGQEIEMALDAAIVVPFPKPRSH